jgi:hypothetical protein
LLSHCRNYRALYPFIFPQLKKITIPVCITNERR